MSFYVKSGLTMGQHLALRYWEDGKAKSWCDPNPWGANYYYARKLKALGLLDNNVAAKDIYRITPAGRALLDGVVVKEER